MNYKNKKRIAVMLSFVFLVTFYGCSANSKTEIELNNLADKSENIQDENKDSNNNENENTKDENNQNTTNSSNDTEITELKINEMFSDRDKEVGYEESSAIQITLKDNLSKSSSNLVSVSENIITIHGEGTFLLSGELSNGQLIIDADKNDKIHLIFKGVNINCDTSAAFYIRQADKVFLTLEEGTENSLSNQKEFVAIDENTIDSVIFSKDDLTLNGLGNLKINAVFGHGIVSKDDLVFTGGTYQITAERHAISGKESVRIANGKFQLTSGKDGIHAEDKDDDSLGFAYIAGGEFEITSDDDGIHASNITAISGGTIHILNSYEGIEGQKIHISGGMINLKSSDDGLNAAGGNDGSGFGGHGGDIFAADENCYIKISGGELYVNAEGDGIDSNGNLYITGGSTYVSGPTNSGNGALDYNGEAEITGGVFVAAGASGMEQNFGTSSTQCCILINASNRQTKAVVLKDNNGKELLSYTPEKEYNSIVISIPEILQGEKYEVILGEESNSIEMTDIIYGAGTTMGHGGMGGHGMKRPDGRKPGTREPNDGTQPEGKPNMEDINRI